MWIKDIRLLVRSIINDVIEPYEYDDSKINTLIIHAAKIMVNELVLPYEINLCNNTITPDPSCDNNFIVLCAYKTSCMFAAAELKAISMNSMSVRDGPSSIDFGPMTTEARKRYEDICDQYEQKKLQFLINNNTGSVISGPIHVEGLNRGIDYGCC